MANNDKGGKKEKDFQAALLKEIETLLPGCIAFKAETYKQGFPDLLILHKDRWAALECKKQKDAKKQPNQEYYVETMNNMSFARFVYPENKKEVLDDLQRALGT